MSTPLSRSLSELSHPFLQDPQSQYADVFATEFVDVWQFPEEAHRSGIRVIPTQIAAEGRELFRHEGYFSKEDILAWWPELGRPWQRWWTC